MLRNLLILLFLFSLTAHLGRSQLYTFRNYNHKDGLYIASILSVSSSNDGSVLLGTAGAGIIRYDGRNFDEILSEENLNHHVTDLCKFKEDLYFSSKYSGIYKLRNGKTTRIIHPYSAKGEWNKVFVCDSGLVCATDYELIIVKEGKQRPFKKFNGKIRVYQFIENEKALIILTSEGTFVWQKGSFKLTSLDNFLKSKKATAYPAFGFKEGNNIVLYDEKLTQRVSIVFNEQGKVFSMEEKKLSGLLNNDEKGIGSTYDSHSKILYILTNKNELISISKERTKRIIHNYDQQLQDCRSIAADLNGDIWISSELKGLYKVSQEPFTKIMLHPVYSMPDIMALHRSDNGDIFISTDDSVTYFGDIRNPGMGFQKLNFRCLAFCESPLEVFCATESGIKAFNKNSHAFRTVLLPGTEGKKITMLFRRETILYVGIAKEGLKKYDLNTGKQIKLHKEGAVPDHFYTTQYLPTLGWQVFGTNNGVFYEETSTGTIRALKLGKKNGAYAGVSIQDVFGNIWVTGERGLTGILENGEIVLLNDPKLFNSKLFYTINSDNYGNLIIGTNKGITILQLNEQGKVIEHNVYTGTTGFSGYETNMRAQFQDRNVIFVGTVEGLFSINTEVLRNFPKPTTPVIEEVQRKKNADQANSFVFQFNTNNPKIPHLLYTYRIIGYQNEWSDLSENSRIYLSNLPNGSYQIQVRSTYDGRIYSDIGDYSITVQLPFWRTRWFMVVLIVTIVVLNIYFIQRRKTFDGGNFFRTRDMLVELNMTPTILFFAFVADVVANYIAPLIDPKIPSLLALSFTSGFLLLALFLTAKNAERNGTKQLFRPLLIGGYLVIMGHYLIAAILTDLNTFYVMPIVVVPTLATYIFERFRHVVIHTLILFIICSTMVLYLDGTGYNKFLFLFVVLITCFISIFVTYLRYDSLEKLLFVSGIVNKGNVQVVAFNDEGVITYVSENISDIITATQDQLLHQQISILNNFLPEEGGYRNVDLTKQFFDGQKYLAPMLGTDQSVNWIEWSCKFFSENVRVILGQNVSDKMELENTYELLVENAEDMIYQCDVNGILKFVNQRTRDLFQNEGDEMENSSSLEFVQEDYREKVEAFYKEHFASRRKASYLEFPVMTKSGEVRWVGQHVTTLFRPGTKTFVNGFLALARDITDNKEQQSIIEEQRDSITSSITYAQRIQLNLLPLQKDFERSFKDHFVIYRPKDIVSGDFYWLHRIDNQTVIALGDCTGHGVPGAFMTLLGINLLNSIVLESRLTEPSQILNEMDRKLISAMRNETGSLNDGIEITICTIDHDTGKLAYACAGSRFLIYEGNGFNMYKGDTKHVGDESMTDFRGYISHYIDLEEDSQVILMTDGFQDQFGGARNKRFSFRRLLELFESNIRLPFDEQKNMIEEEFENWKHQFEQTDDVTVVSFRNPNR